MSGVGVRAEAIDGRRCRFVLDRAVYPGKWGYFGNMEEAKGAPLAERLFGVEGVTSVLIAHEKVTICREEAAGLPVLGGAIRMIRALVGEGAVGEKSWAATAKAVGAAIREHLASGEAAVGEACAWRAPSEGELRARIQKVLDEDVNPVVAGHGGGVSILDVKDNNLYLQMWGGCQGCGLSENTLKNGVEGAVREAVPEVGEIVDLTDHGAGKNPWRRR